MIKSIKRYFKRVSRHIKEGFVGVYRNAATSISSCFAVTITLIIVGVFLVLSYNVQQVTKGVEGDLQISVLIDNEYSTDEQIDTINKQIDSIDGIQSIEYSTKQQELENFLSYYDEEEAKLYMPDGADNPMPNTFYVRVIDGKDIQMIDDKIKTIEGVSETNYGGASIIALVDMFHSIRYGILVLVIGIALLSIFLVHNTIKLTINARKKEISIMRNVGAKNGYIRAPFVIEGLIIGFIGSIIPSLLLYFGYDYLYDITNGQILTKILSLVEPYPFIYHVCLLLIGSGMFVGLLGSFISVTRYLRWKR